MVAQKPDFQREIRPILSDNCFLCHGPDESTRKANLRLDLHEGALAARRNGAPIVPGKPEQSLLYKKITERDPARRMPPLSTHKTLTDAQKAIIKVWIEQGADWKQHWAFIAPVHPVPPAVINLAPGLYRVDGELVGFRKFSRENVEVSVNTTVRVDIALTVGQLEESVMVTGEAPMLQTDRSDTGRIIESTQITQLPLGFNRNFQALLITVPGASRPFRPHSEFYNSQESLSSNVNGQSRQMNNVQLEGADNSDNGGSLAFYIPSAEAIDIVSVATSNYDAEFGRAGGAVTNVHDQVGNQ